MCWSARCVPDVEIAYVMGKKGGIAALATDWGKTGWVLLLNSCEISQLLYFETVY